DLQEKVILLDDVALAHGQVDNLTHHVRGEVDLALGVDASVRRDLGGQILPRHFAVRDRRDVLAAPRREPGGEHARDDQYDDSDDDFGATLHVKDLLVERT